MNATTAAGVPAMAQQARELARAGRINDASALWQRVLALDPNHTEALLAMATQALARRDSAGALQVLHHAAATAPRDPMVQLYIALALKDLDRPEEEMAAITRALAIDPYFYPALLHKAMLLERLGSRRQAARVFKDVLNIMPPPEQAGPGFMKAAEHAKTAIEENRRSLERHLEGVLSDLRKRHSAARLDRFEETLAVMTGAKKRYSPEPGLLHFAQLPPLQFYPNDLFPWIPELEAATEDIRRECEAVLAADGSGPVAGGQPPPGSSAGSPRATDDLSLRSPFFLWKNGEKLEANCERCPRTIDLVSRLPLAYSRNFSPSVLFSVLRAGTAMPPRRGDTNARLVVHLPLIVSPDCTFRVGNETREWEYGKAWVFDDSVEHEARNEGGGSRVQLVFDVWNPYLTDAERELVTELLNGVRDYYAAD